MSRIAKNPVTIPSGVSITLAAQDIAIKGNKGALTYKIHPLVEVKQDGTTLHVAPRNKSTQADALAGTMRALIHNMVAGVVHGFERKLELVGVGYRAQVQAKKLNLTLGFSHPVIYEIPTGITIETPSQTEIVIKGADKQLVGQVAADIRGYRSPEPYKGKGVRYAGEQIELKETKKK